MLLEIHEFYKVIIIKLNLICSKIVNERHFATYESAEAYANTIDEPETIIIITMM